MSPSHVTLAPQLAELLAEARAEYAARLPAKVAAIAALIVRGRWAEVRRAAHQLRGSATTYGFAEVGAVARAMEEELIASAIPPDELTRGSLGVLLEEVRALCARCASAAGPGG